MVIDGRKNKELGEKSNTGISKDTEDLDQRYKGLYRMDIDGSNVLVLDSEVYLEEVGIGISEDWIFYVSTNRPTHPILNRIKKDGTIDVHMEGNN